MTAPADATTAAAAGEVTTSEEKSLPPAATGPGGFVILLLVLSILILPFVIGSFVAKSLNVPEWSSRIGVVILTLLLGISPFLMSLLKGQPLSERFRLGIDLAGGTNMVFQVRGEGKEITPSVMDQMVGAVSRRINQSGTEEITVRAVGTDRIEVIVPGEDPQTVDDIKRPDYPAGQSGIFHGGESCGFRHCSTGAGSRPVSQGSRDQWRSACTLGTCGREEW